MPFRQLNLQLTGKISLEFDRLDEVIDSRFSNYKTEALTNYIKWEHDTEEAGLKLACL